MKCANPLQQYHANANARHLKPPATLRSTKRRCMTAAAELQQLSGVGRGISSDSQWLLVGSIHSCAQGQQLQIKHRHDSNRRRIKHAL